MDIDRGSSCGCIARGRDCVVACVAIHRGEYGQAAEEATSSHVKIGAFRRTYFPHPECIADAVVFRRGVGDMLPLGYGGLVVPFFFFGCRRLRTRQPRRKAVLTVCRQARDPRPIIS